MTVIMPCCMDYMARGRCRILDKGEVCELNHNPDLYNEAREIDRVSLQVCANYIRHGRCRFGAGCRHIHNDALRQAKVARDIAKAKELKSTSMAWVDSLTRESASNSVIKSQPQIWAPAAAATNTDDDHGKSYDKRSSVSLATRAGSISNSSSSADRPTVKVASSIIVPKYQPDISFEAFFGVIAGPSSSPKAELKQSAKKELDKSDRAVETFEPEAKVEPFQPRTLSNSGALKKPKSRFTFEQQAFVDGSVRSLVDQSTHLQQMTSRPIDVSVPNNVCWNFINRKCRYGEQCSKYHDFGLRNERKQLRKKKKHEKSESKLDMIVAVNGRSEAYQQSARTFSLPRQEHHAVKPALGNQARRKTLSKYCIPEEQRNTTTSADCSKDFDVEPSSKHVNRNLQGTRSYHIPGKRTNASIRSSNRKPEKTASSQTSSNEAVALHEAKDESIKDGCDSKHGCERKKSFSLWTAIEYPLAIKLADATAFPTIKQGESPNSRDAGDFQLTQIAAASTSSKTSKSTQAKSRVASDMEPTTAVQKMNVHINVNAPASLRMTDPKVIAASSAWSRPISIPDRHKPKPQMELPASSAVWTVDDDVRWAAENLDPKRRAIFFRNPKELQPKIDRGPLFSFHDFRFLPAEIRLQIWELCMKSAGPRTVRLEYHEDRDEDTNGITNTYFKSESSLPAMFHVNREARTVALPYYEQAFGTVHQPGSIPFNFSKDELFLRCPGAGFLPTTIERIPEGDCVRVKKVYVALKDWVFCEREHTFAMNIARFKACRRLLLMAGDGLTERRWTTNQERAIGKLQKALGPYWSKLNRSPPPMIRFWIIPALKAKELKIDSFYW